MLSRTLVNPLCPPVIPARLTSVTLPRQNKTRRSSDKEAATRRCSAGLELTGRRLSHVAATVAHFATNSSSNCFKRRCQGFVGHADMQKV